MRFILLEARAGIEPAYKGFADLCLTTWLPRPEGIALGRASFRTIPRTGGGSQFRHDWQQNVRRELLTVINRLLRRFQQGFVGHGKPGVRITVESRKIAARYLQPDAVPFLENVARDTCVD